MCRQCTTSRNIEKISYPVLSLEDNPELMDMIALFPDSVLSETGPRELAQYFAKDANEDEKILILAYAQTRLPSYEGQFRRHLKDPLLGLIEDSDF